MLSFRIYGLTAFVVVVVVNSCYHLCKESDSRAPPFFFPIVGPHLTLMLPVSKLISVVDVSLDRFKIKTPVPDAKIRIEKQHSDF